MAKAMKTKTVTRTRMRRKKNGQAKRTVSRKRR